MRVICVFILLLMRAPAAMAGEADVMEVTFNCDTLCAFQVTILHADEGWDHYADRFEIIGPDGALLGIRKLLHSHVDEQPFTRGLSGVAIPDGVTGVTVRAHDSRHGYGGREVHVNVIPSH